VKAGLFDRPSTRAAPGGTWPLPRRAWHRRAAGAKGVRDNGIMMHRSLSLSSGYRKTAFRIRMPSTEIRRFMDSRLIDLTDN
jgi:hypothetical protein